MFNLTLSNNYSERDTFQYLSILRNESFRNKTFRVKFLAFLSPGGVFQIVNNKWYVHED